MTAGTIKGVHFRLVDLNRDNKLDIIGREGSQSEMKWINDGNNIFKLNTP